jgi:hypothetical protein
MELILAVSTKMEATFTNAVTGQPTNIYLHGDMFGGFAVLSLGEGGPPIAQITRDFASARDIFINAQTVSWAITQLWALRSEMELIRASTL